MEEQNMSKPIINGTSSIRTTDFDLVRFIRGLIFIGGLVSNILLLLPFINCRNHSLYTPFNLYLVNLAVANILRILAQIAPMIIVYLDNHITLVGAHCNFLTVSDSFMNGLIVSLHGLIAVNRAWAIIHPFSYRTWHSRRVSLASCQALWMGNFLMHGVHLLAIRLMGPALPANTTCLLAVTYLGRSVKVTAILGFALPMMCVGSAFVLIVIATCRREATRRRKLRINPTSLPPTLQTAGTSQHQSTAMNDQHQGTVRVHLTAADGRSNWGQKHLLLTLLTVSVTICYLPYMLFFLLMTPRQTVLNRVWYNVVYCLFQLQTVLDVVLFVLPMKALRSALCRNLKCLFCPCA